MSLFKKAEKKRVPLKIALTGPSGAGKTYSALAIAKGIGGRIAVLDTENGSASLYSDRFDFEVVEMQPPYLTEKYNSVIAEAEKEGFDVLIIDSISHAWAAEGGLMDQKESLDNRGGKQNKYTNWATITKKHEAFKAKMLQSKMHLIVTMRSKQDYVLDADNKPKKVGMAPIQREGMEYEFTVVFDLAADHTALASKDRTSIFSEIFKPSEETGKTLMAWRGTNSIEPPVKAAPPAAQPTQAPVVPPVEKAADIEAPPAIPETTAHRLPEPLPNENYRIPITGPYKDRLILEVRKDHLKGYAEYIQGEINKDPSKNNKVVQDFLDRVMGIILPPPRVETATSAAVQPESSKT